LDNYVIRTMTRDEVDFAVALAAGESWNPGNHDADSFYAADPEGFLIGLLDDEPIACISAVRYGERYGFIGFYIVRPEHRGKGYGYAIWQEAMHRLEGRDVGLDGVVAQIDNYCKSGFEYMYPNLRYQGLTTDEGTDDPRIVALADVPFEDVLAFDTALVPAPRPAFLQRWIAQPDTVALGLRDGDTLLGYGVLRPARDGYRVGPLFANDRDAASALLLALMRRVRSGSTIYIDVPGEEQNPAATALARELGMSPMFEAARMYRMWDKGTKISLPLHRWFGVTTLELG
jgi:GNAT superfamily N-acetyltransferase